MYCCDRRMAATGTWLAVVVVCRLSFVLASDSSESETIGSRHHNGDGVRCYCNTAECVSTSYMCRAPPDGGCYSELEPRARRQDGRYGCLHQLADTLAEALQQCQNTPNKEPEPPSRAGRPQRLLLCCFQDLCNHDDSLARRRLNLTAQGVSAESRSGYGSGEVWFKAATIAVPVCGALILFLLVGVAVRLLKQDAADLKLRGPYMSAPPQGGEKKALGAGACAPLLVTPNGCLVRVERAELTSVQLYPDAQLQQR